MIKQSGRISLLNINKNQASAVEKLLSVAEHGVRISAGWDKRKPVINTIVALPPRSENSFESDPKSLILEPGQGDALYFQKVLKAFGNRVADAARKPLRFERGAGGGEVHLVPAFHHIATCGSQRVLNATDDDINCRSCILAALTPASGEKRDKFNPYGHVYLRDSEIGLLRDHAIKRARNAALL